MKKSFMVFIVFLSILIAGCTSSEGNKYYGAKYLASNHNPGGSNVEEASGFALELSKHNNAADCWVAYGNEVYDISNYLMMEPDSKLEAYCGTTAFETVVDSYNLKFSDIESVSIYQGGLNE